MKILLEKCILDQLAEGLKRRQTGINPFAFGGIFKRFSRSIKVYVLLKKLQCQLLQRDRLELLKAYVENHPLRHSVFDRIML
ncbi:hypothetical protein D3C71_1961100 [compost metagenome]